MKVLALLSVCLVCATAMPRYIMVPVEHHRVLRAVEDQAQPIRRHGGHGGHEGHEGHGAPFFDAIRSAGIPSANAGLAAGSSFHDSHPGGKDFVDYGAQMGPKGAFSWYSDHPVLLCHGHGCHH